jgi:hypothetical protein
MTRGFLRFVRGNTIALLALFIALGGTTYAASTALIGKNTVASPQVVNGSLQTKDLSGKARKALKGNRGLRGLAGAQGTPGAAGAPGARGATGPAGVSPAKYFAHISYSGATPSVAYGSGGITVSPITTGATSVTFPTNVSQCANLATLYDSGADGSVRKGTGSGGATVLMQVKDLSNTAQNWGYDIAEFC